MLEQPFGAIVNNVCANMYSVSADFDRYKCKHNTKNEIFPKTTSQQQMYGQTEEKIMWWKLEECCINQSIELHIRIVCPTEVFLSTKNTNVTE